MVDTGSLNTTTDDSLVVSAVGPAGPLAAADRETAIVSPTAPRRRAFRLMPPPSPSPPPPPGGDRWSEDDEAGGGGGREIQVLRQVRAHGGQQITDKQIWNVLEERV